MFVYNITLKIEKAIESAWLEWQQKEHIPDILATGCFAGNKFYRLLNTEDTDEVTYVSQFFSVSQEELDRYLEAEAEPLRKKATEKWGDQFLAFRTIMEQV